MGFLLLILFFSNTFASNSTLLEELEASVNAYRAKMVQLRIPEIRRALVDLAKQEAKEGKTFCTLDVLTIVKDDSIAAQAAIAFVEYWKRHENNIHVVLKKKTNLRLCWSGNLSCHEDHFFVGLPYGSIKIPYSFSNI